MARSERFQARPHCCEAVTTGVDAPCGATAIALPGARRGAAARWRVKRAASPLFAMIRIAIDHKV
jgi:hypothetical protein